VPEPVSYYHLAAGPPEWESPEELARDDDWSCPSENSRRCKMPTTPTILYVNATDIIYLDPRGRNPLNPRSPGSDIACFASTLRDAESDVYEAISEDDQRSEFSMDTITMAHGDKPEQTATQRRRFKETRTERFKEWIAKPKHLTGALQRYPGN
jgi:hypothetical protein